MLYLLDTNAVIALLKDSQSKLAARVRRCRTDEVGISSVVCHELFYGAWKSARQGDNVRIIDTLQFEVLDFTRSDAREAGRVRAELARRGSPIGPYDILIAGQALARKLTLVSRNTEEFRRVRGLKLESWE